MRALETLGTCRRGYFVEGLGGAQFALGGAVERLRELRPRDGEEAEPLVLAAADPAQPYGAVLPWPKRADGRAARVAGAHVVLLGGEPALYVERGGRSLVPLRDPDPEWLRPALDALVSFVRRGGAKRFAVERFDGEPVAETEAMQLLVEAGFLAGPRRAVLARNVHGMSDYNTAVIEEFRANDGRVGGHWEGRDLLLLTTTGRKSGRKHTTPMVYTRDGDRLLVYASKAGAPEHPDWYLNLVASSRVTVEVGAARYEATAVPLEGEERDRTFAEHAERFPAFAEYQAKTDRVIPVVALERS